MTAELISSSEAAAICGITKNRFNRWVRAGHVPVDTTLDNGHRVFNRADIERFASSLSHSVTPPKTVNA